MPVRKSSKNKNTKAAAPAFGFAPARKRVDAVAGIERTASGITRAVAEDSVGAYIQARIDFEGATEIRAQRISDSAFRVESDR